jgi:hypothetical protein
LQRKVTGTARTASGQVRAKKLRPGCVRCSSDNRRNGDQAVLNRLEFVHLLNWQIGPR